MTTMPALYVRNYEHVTYCTNSGYAFANRIAWGIKTIETRGYPAPDSHLGKRIAIVATYKGKRKSEVVCTAILRGWKWYENENDFRDDFKKHWVRNELSPYRWGSTKEKYGWILEDVQQVDGGDWTVNKGGRVWTTANDFSGHLMEAAS
jgi:hypothetical protein